VSRPKATPATDVWDLPKDDDPNPSVIWTPIKKMKGSWQKSVRQANGGAALGPGSLHGGVSAGWPAAKTTPPLEAPPIVSPRLSAVRFWWVLPADSGLEVGMKFYRILEVYEQKGILCFSAPREGQGVRSRLRLNEIDCTPLCSIFSR